MQLEILLREDLIVTASFHLDRRDDAAGIYRDRMMLEFAEDEDGIDIMERLTEDDIERILVAGDERIAEGAGGMGDARRMSETKSPGQQFVDKVLVIQWLRGASIERQTEHTMRDPVAVEELIREHFGLAIVGKFDVPWKALA